MTHVPASDFWLLNSGFYFFFFGFLVSFLGLRSFATAILPYVECIPARGRRKIYRIVGVFNSYRHPRHSMVLPNAAETRATSQSHVASGAQATCVQP